MAPVLKRKQIDNYTEAVEYLLNLPKFIIGNTLEDTRKFLEKMGKPDKGMKIIHIAGTNGKGSVCAYLRAVLEEAGYTCGTFTSPHLVEVRERFYFGGEMVSKELFMEAFWTIYNMLDCDSLENGEGYNPTQFEYLFFISMYIFSKQKPDFCILETGLGGRLDATNAVNNKEVSIITRIGMDHMEYLGDTLPQIAGEKAEIIASNRPVVFWDEDEKVTKVMIEKAKVLQAEWFSVSKSDYTFLKNKNKNIDFSYHSRYYGYIRLCLSTIARYQLENASLALRALEVIDQGKTIHKEHMIQGIHKAFWAGRMEEVLPEVFIDGAHNIDGIRAFIETVEADTWEGKRHLLFSVVKDKDYSQMVAAIMESNLFDKISIAGMQGARAMATKELKIIFEQYTKENVDVYDETKEAYNRVILERDAGERIYVAGSLYLVGEIKGIVGRCSHD